MKHAFTLLTVLLSVTILAASLVISAHQLAGESERAIEKSYEVQVRLLQEARGLPPMGRG